MTIIFDGFSMNIEYMLIGNEMTTDKTSLKKTNDDCVFYFGMFNRYVDL